jgi:transposase
MPSCWSLLVRLASFLATVFPQWAALRLDALTLTEQQIIVELSSTRPSARCPDCQRRSHRTHSRFTRVLADLPLAHLPVSVQLHGRRFRCLNAACPRQTFRERLPAVAPCYQRRTPALRHRLEAVGFALGGQAGQRLARTLQMGRVGTSGKTLLRLVRRASLPQANETAAPLHVLGVDDFALRRGMRYGAILVDLEQHRVVDVLPDREAATFANWLKQHAGTAVEVVSRDRSGAFADGARQAAPQAVQVADRFHLLQNLGQALDRLLTREQRVLTRVADAVVTVPERTPVAAAAPTLPPPPPMTHAERDHAAVEARRQARYQQVVAWAEEGCSIREIARRARLCRGTVRRYLTAGQYLSCAARARRPQAGDAYAAYLRGRWDAGEHNSATLLAEIRAQGYTGAASTLRQYVAAWRAGSRRPGRSRQKNEVAQSPPRRRSFSLRQTRWVLLRPLEELDQDERAYREALCQEHATIATAQALVTEFGRIVRARADTDLAMWLEVTAHTHIPELVSFVNGVRRDYDAVRAALSSPHSQGQTEGQVNRLKMLKRQTYGRANFDLLRCRVLYHAA